MGLIIRSSAIHAAGCYTTTPIRKGAHVAEYTGHRMSKEEADARYEDSPITYLFGLGSGEMVIDGHCMAMFINHSCDPNCESSEEDGRVWITGHPQHRRGRGDHLRLLPLRRRRRRGHLQLRREEVPRNDVLEGRDSPPQSCGQESPEKSRQ